LDASFAATLAFWAILAEPVCGAELPAAVPVLAAPDVDPGFAVLAPAARLAALEIVPELAVPGPVPVLPVPAVDPGFTAIAPAARLATADIES
jgi:hypothetical protein